MATAGNHTPRQRISFGPFCLSPNERLLSRDGEEIDIGGRSFDLLVVLTGQPGRVFSKRDLLKRVWSDAVVEDGSLRFHMAGLRKLLGNGENGARYIATQVGVGYAFVAPVKIDADSLPVTLAGINSRARETSNIPARLPRMIGRERDLRLLSERVKATPLFTIVGPAGVGKTSLAIEIGHDLTAQFNNRVAFVDFSMLENPALVPSMTAGAMGVPVHSEDPSAAILACVGDDPFLLLLDNCEHVIEPAAQLLERLIGAASNVRIVATSREPLRLRSENVHRLEALAYPEEPQLLGLHELLEYPAIQLFCERAAAADSSLRIDENAARLVAGMCLKLDGMALPIELAAVRVATHGLAGTAQQLGERFSLGWSGRRTAAPRQQTLQSMLDWSYDLLSVLEQRVLERLSVFVGPFSIDASIAVVADPELGADRVAVALDELVSKSLVAAARVRDAGNYRLLEMTRAYARRKLSARGSEEVDSVVRRHASFYLSELEAVAGREEDVLQDTRLLGQQLGNIRSALEWSFSRSSERRLAIRLTAACAPVFLTLSQLVECRNWCARALVEVEVDDALVGTSTELELQSALGISLMFTGREIEAAGAAFARALDIAKAIEDRWNELRMLGRLHIFHQRIGEYSAAMEYAERAIGVAGVIDDAEALSVAYSLSGISHHLAGNQKRARHDLELSIAHSTVFTRDHLNRYGFDYRSRSSIALARTLWLMGDAEGAASLARLSVRESMLLDHPLSYCVVLIWSLSVCIWMGDMDAAQKDLEAFAMCAEANALSPHEAVTRGFRAQLAIRSGQADGAVDVMKQSLDSLRAARFEFLTTPFSIALVRGLLLDGKDNEARDLVESTISRCVSNGERCELPELLRLKAEMLARVGASKEAVAVLVTALSMSRDQGAELWMSRCAADLRAMNPATSEEELERLCTSRAPVWESNCVYPPGGAARRSG